MYDKLLSLQTLTTQTTGFTGTAIDLKTGTPRRGLKARVITTAWSQPGANSVLQHKLQDSDNNTTYYDLVMGMLYTGAAGAVAAEEWLNFETSRRYVRHIATMTVTTGTPSVAYQSDIGIARP